MMKEIIEKIGVSWKKKTSSQKKIFLATLILFFIGALFLGNINFAQAGGAAPATGLGAGTGTGPGGSFTDTIMNMISWLMMKIAQWCIQLVTFVLTFIIQLASYNGYLNSSAVNTGWVMVRDLTNMFFVVALLAIAFGTILGVEHYEWKHMLFKLVSAAILVNFSRIICGILIDIAQVVMVTFVNGIAATVGANFIRAFSLEKIQSFSGKVNGGAINATQVFLSAMASLFLAVTILFVMGAMLLMLLARMIVLWVLIVLSPIAFVFGVLHQTEHYAQEWWSEFGKNVITGPVLVFFIWLTLVTVGSGTVNQEFQQGLGQGIQSAAPTDVGILEVMTGDNLINFFIAIGMLVVGLRTTQHLGGIGAEWTGSAIDVGKKTALAVSGVALARDMTRKTAEGVKSYASQKYENFTAMPKGFAGVAKARFDRWRDSGAKSLEEGSKKMKGLQDKLAAGIITKDEFDATVKGDKVALTRIARAKAAKRADEESIKLRASMTAEGKSAQEISRAVSDQRGKILNEELKNRDEALEGPKKGVFRSIGRGLKTATARLIVESGGRAAKRAKDWEAWVENEKTITEEEYSTSANYPGIKKLESSVRVHAAEERATAKRREKEALTARKFTVQGDELFTGFEKTAWKSEAGAQVHEAFVKGHSAIEKQKIEQKAGLYDAKVRQEIEEGLARARDNKGVAASRERALEPLMVNGQAIKVDHTERSLHAAEARIDQLVSDEGSRREYKEKAELLHQQAATIKANEESKQVKEAISKKEEKEGAETKEKLSKEGQYIARERRITGFTAELNQIQDKMATKRQLELLSAIKDLLAKGGTGDARQAEIFADQAKKEQIELENSMAKERKVAEARDNYLISEGKQDQAVNLQNVLAKQQKMRIEAQSIGDYPLAVARQKAQMKVLDDAIVDGDQEKIRKAKEGLSNMLVAAMGRHTAIYGGLSGGMGERFSRESDQSMALDPDSIRRRQAELLSNLIVEKVELTGKTAQQQDATLQAALNKFIAMKGGADEGQAALEQVRLYLDKGAGEGFVGLAGLLKTRINDQGKPEVELTSTDRDGLKYVSSRRTNALADAKITDVVSFAGAVDSNKEGKTVIESNESIDVLYKIVSPLTSNNYKSINEFSKGDMASVLQFSDTTKLEELFKKFENMKDKGALSALLQDALERFSEEARAAATAKDPAEEAKREKMIQDAIVKFKKP